MITKNIFLKSFPKKNNEKKIKKELKLILDEENELYRSMSKKYHES